MVDARLFLFFFSRFESIASFHSESIFLSIYPMIDEVADRNYQIQLVDSIDPHSACGRSTLRVTTTYLTHTTHNDTPCLLSCISNLLPGPYPLKCLTIPL